MRRITIDIRDHDDYVSGAQIRVGTETRQELVVQDFDFALSAVGNVKTDGTVLRCIDRWPKFACLVERTQFENVVLKLVKHVVRLGLAEQVDAAVTKGCAVAVRVVVAVEQVDVVATLFAPRGQ